jgi:uncharacterized membrane protein
MTLPGEAPIPTFPTSAGLFLGLGLGGFFDGIVLHQLLQWHHLASHVHPPLDLAALKTNVVWDGVFHSLTYVFVLVGLLRLWQTARRVHLRWSSSLFAGTILMGFGLFNTVEGLINHQLLGLHHVNETVPPSQWLLWDLGFLAWGIAMIIGGWRLHRSGRLHGRE